MVGRLFVFIFVLFTSCGNNKVEKISSKEIKLISFKKYSIEKLLSPRKVRICDSVIVILDPKCENPVHLLQKKSFKLINSIGKLGVGPNEIVSPSTIHYNELNKCIYVHDMRKKQLFEVKTNQHDGLNMPFAISLQGENINASTIYESLPVNKDSFIFISFAKNNYLLFSDIKGKILKKEGHLPNNDKLKSCIEDFYGYAFGGFYTYNQLKKKLVLAMGFNDIVRIYSQDFSTFKDIKVGKNETKFEVRNGLVFLERHPVFSFLDISSTKEYIYALFSGEKQTSENDCSTAKKIFKIDWDGNIVSVYNLPIGISSFDIDPVQKIIYGININENNIYLISLKE